MRVHCKHNDGDCGGIREDFPGARCNKCHKMTSDAHWVLGILGSIVGITGTSLLLYYTIITGSTETAMPLFWNIVWALSALVIVGGILTAGGLFGLHRLRAAMKRRAIKDDYKEKGLETKLHHEHMAFVESVEQAAEMRKKLLTEGDSSPVPPETEGWKGEPVTKGKKPRGKAAEAMDYVRPWTVERGEY